MRIKPSTLLFIALATAIAALRLYHCTRMMAGTGDLIRHVYYGVLVNQSGWSAAGRPLNAFPSLAGVTWSWVPYNYPIVTLAFFSALAALWPTLFFAKLALTLVEAANAALVWRLTASRWLAALYWAAPVSVWWVSREGQFEPLQNLFVLAALCLLRPPGGTPDRLGVPALAGIPPEGGTPELRRPFFAFALLALGVQVKLSAIFLLPFFIVAAIRDRRRFFPCALGFLAGLLPTMLAMRAYPVLNAVGGHLAALHYNPYYWNPLNASWRAWVPLWLALVNAAVTWTALGLLAWGLLRPASLGQRAACLAPLLFLIAVKTHATVQFWYMVLWPSFVLPIPDRRLRWALMLLYPLLDLTSVLALGGWVLGPHNPPAYQHLSVFAVFR